MTNGSDSAVYEGRRRLYGGDRVRILFGGGKRNGQEATVVRYGHTTMLYEVRTDDGATLMVYRHEIELAVEIRNWMIEVSVDG